VQKEKGNNKVVCCWCSAHVSACIIYYLVLLSLLLAQLAVVAMDGWMDGWVGGFMYSLQSKVFFLSFQRACFRIKEGTQQKHVSEACLCAVCVCVLCASINVADF